MNIFNYFKVGSIVVEEGFNMAINNWTLRTFINYYYKYKSVHIW